MTPGQAYRKVRTAIKTGVLVRLVSCERCNTIPLPTSDGRAAIQAHHHDYSKPLDVEWICAKCHRDETPFPEKMGTPIYGERNGQAKLTADQVKYIRTSTRSGADIAKEFGVDRSTVNKVRKGVYWLSATPDHIASGGKMLSATPDIQQPAKEKS